MENDKTLSDFFKLISEAKSEQNSNSVSETVQPQEETSLIQASLNVLKSKNQITEQAPPTEFVTHEEMKTHYIGFLNSIQKQMSTIGGGGEVRFSHLTDVDFSTAAAGRHLTYNPETGKVEFEPVTSAELTDDGYTITLTDQTISVSNLPTGKTIGPIDALRFNTSNINTYDSEGIISWNAADETLNIYHGDGVVQQVGQEMFAFVRNDTGTTIANGTVVRFSGAHDSDGEARLEVAPFLADGTFPSLYLIGISTEDISDGAEGKITTFGKLRGINTTGSSVGETWQVGDVLYANPASAGNLTRVKPTAPSNVVPVAAVLKVDATQGQLFVRPTHEQKMIYGKFALTQDATVDATNTAYQINLDETLEANGVSLDSDGGLVVSQSGLFQIDVSTQIDVGGGVFNQGQMYMWLRVNDSDVPLSTRRQAVTSTLSAMGMNTVFVISLNENDVVDVMYAGDDTQLLFSFDSATAFAPTTAAALVAITQVQL
jgi:hypothetical protein